MSTSPAHVLFETPSHAFEATQKLHAHVFKGALLSATLKKRIAPTTSVPSSAPSGSKPAKPSGPTPSRASRLIVRNLPFDVTEQDLRALFLPYGTIYSVNLPRSTISTTDTKENADGEGAVKEEGEEPRIPPAPRGKGFAFVWMWTKREAEKAMEGVNGKTVRAGMAEELVRDKQMRKKDRREAKKGKDKEEAKEKGRVVAVDWALSKERWEEEKQKMEEEASEEEGEDASETDKEEDESGDGKDDDGHVGLHDDSDSQPGSEVEDEDEDEDRSDAEERAKPQLPPPEAGTTLFVRNIPFEATEDELRAL